LNGQAIGSAMAEDKADSGHSLFLTASLELVNVL